MNPNPTEAPRGRAIVMGASMAGLLAARILRERFAEVVLLERDTLPAGAAPRKGTPHAVHPHGLLARGREVLEALFPGFTQALVDQGAVRGDLQRNIAFDADRQRFARSDSGHMALAVSRLAIEAELRRRVLAQPGVRLIDGVAVGSPVFDAARARVTGVQYVSATSVTAASATPMVLDAGLVVDCTGRASRLSSWLRDWGFEPPVEEKVVVGVAYTSAYFKRDARNAPEIAAIIGAATPGQPYPAVLIAQEPDADGQARWVAGVGGYAGDHAQPTLAAMLERARQVGCAEIAELAQHGEPIGPVIRYGFPYSVRRRYERLARFPAGLLAMGDALTSFNPIYGQGMTVAACEALELRRVLAQGLDAAPRRFFRAASKVIDVPWQLAVGSDLSLPMVEGARPLPVRIVNAYIARLRRAAVRDAVVAKAFLKVIHMIAPPPTLFAPAVLARVLWRGGRHDDVHRNVRPELDSYVLD